jgi:hypothetical protein
MFALAVALTAVLPAPERAQPVPSRAWRAADTLASALCHYRRARQRHLAPYYRILAADARARQMNPIQRLLFAAAARDPQTAALFHRFAERSIPPRRLLAPRALARAARVGVWPRASRPAAAVG